MISTCTKTRLNNDRRVLWLLMAILTFTLFAMRKLRLFLMNFFEDHPNIFFAEGSANVSYLFLREKFGFNVRENSFYDAATMMILVLGTIFGLVFLKKLLKMSDIHLALIAFISAVLEYIVKAFAYEPWHLYMALGIAFLKGLGSPMCRSLISSVVPSNEIGKVFSITTSFEAIAPLASAPLYTYVYTNTFKTFAGAYNLISAVVYFSNFVMAM